MKPSAFLGLRTVVYYVPDMNKAKAWYRSLLGVDPYFDQPFYIGFNVGGFELGLHPASAEHPVGTPGAVSYWGVERMTVAWPRLLGLGATAVNAPQDGRRHPGRGRQGSVREPDRDHREPALSERGVVCAPHGAGRTSR
jgi:catechol 2,3-dioxygenase-like lactoylglutathione lyase family enzyme